jgi:hypothetical protein
MSHPLPTQWAAPMCACEKEMGEKEKRKKKNIYIYIYIYTRNSFVIIPLYQIRGQEIKHKDK